MIPARIAELLRPFLPPFHSEPAQSGGEEPVSFSAVQLQHISTYIDLLLRWNARVNLTAVREPEQIVTRHFGESFFAACHLHLEDAGSFVRVADVGSGAGFPGIPIKLWAPNISLTLIESNHKKAAFLREVARSLTLTSVDVLAARAESLNGALFDVVTVRAVEHFESIVPVATRLLAPAGRLALLIGSAQLPKSRSMLPQVTWREPKPIPLSNSRLLVIGHLETLGGTSFTRDQS
jgi:16S rRNA (guanine527-N7)-methyltransferase